MTDEDVMAANAETKIQEEGKATDAVDAVSVKKAAAFPVKAARTMINHWTSALSIRVLFR